jgi:hypothetical protein
LPVPTAKQVRPSDELPGVRAALPLAASVLLGVLAAAQAPPRPRNALTPHVIDPALWRPIDSPELRVRPLAISTSQALSLRQDPTVLLARDDHGIRLRNFTRVG